MPIEESYRGQALEKVQKLGKFLEEELQNLLKEVEKEDLDFGVSASLSGGLLSSLWKEYVEDNNYMEVSFVEVMEHHDGAYLKATFRNSTQNYTAEYEDISVVGIWEAIPKIPKVLRLYSKIST
jgi:phage tail tube protein FII